MRDDFVVDDGGAEGYMDNGQEDWLEADEDEEEDDRPRGCHFPGYPAPC